MTVCGQLAMYAFNSLKQYLQHYYLMNQKLDINININFSNFY
jgi:hypothetical protein